MSKSENKGLLKTWKDDRGFGFIKPEDGSDDIFIHISALKDSARRPFRGDTIFYQVQQSDDGKFKAVNARIEGVEIVPDNESKSKTWLWVVAIILGLVSAAAATTIWMN